MEIVRWVFVGFAILCTLFLLYVTVSIICTIIRFEISEYRHMQKKKQLKQVEKDNLKRLVEEAAQKEIFQKQFQESIIKQIEENEKWN